MNPPASPFPASAPAPAPAREIAGHDSALRRYYALHARLYDATRWTFLFGRSRLVDEIARRCRPRHLLEIGCGTGINLARLARRFPDASLAGWDGSPDMLARARRRLAPLGGRCRLHQGFYGPGRPPSAGSEPVPDLILVSYCLSMVNPGWEAFIDTALADLAPGGSLAVVDFHGSRHPGFRRWMAMNHVRLERHLRPRLREVCRPALDEVHRAWGGVWDYFLFLGSPVARRNAPEASPRD